MDVLVAFRKQKTLLAQTGFQTTFWDLGHVKNLLVSPAGFQTTFLDFGHLKNLLGWYLRGILFVGTNIFFVARTS